MAKKTNRVSARATSEEDKALGAKIRAFRNMANISQADLGAALDPPVSFQQIQKYEKGMNRVTHTKLMQICKALNCTVADMMADLKGDGQTLSQSGQLVAMMGDHATFRMVKAFMRIPRDMQYKFVAIVESVADANAA